MSKVERAKKPEGNTTNALRRGWTTGACATAATKSALNALITGEFIDPVKVDLPKGDQPSFSLVSEKAEATTCEAGIVKDAGDDPDVTHGATILSRVRQSEPGTGIVFKAGEGVGIVTKSGLPIPAGEPAINPVPRRLMIEVVKEICQKYNFPEDVEITISVPGGEKIAERTWNPRLGIVGGISILGTTGVVHPFSCSAWIHSIHRGIDVARAENIGHVLGATGSTSENAANEIYGFPEIAQLDMGDFVGGLLKYLRKNPVPRITLAGGFAKFTKLAQGAMDLHSGRSQVDMNWLADLAVKHGLNQNFKKSIQNANSALEVLEMTQDSAIHLPDSIADLAQQAALKMLNGAPVEVEVLIISREGKILARTDWK